MNLINEFKPEKYDKVHRKENLIDKALISNPASGTMEVSFSNYKLNQNLPDSKFSIR